MSLIYSFVIAYFLTNLIEFIPLHFLHKADLKEKIVGLLKINTITLPVVWLLLSFFFNEYYFFAFVVIEILVVLAETFLIRTVFNRNIKDSFTIAAAMNISSAVIGFFLF